MSRPRNNPAPNSKPPPVRRGPPDAADRGDRLRPWLLGGVIALCVARPLWPSESAAAYGDGLPAVMLWIALGVLWMLGAIGRPQFYVRAGWTDAAMLALLAWHTLAAVVATTRGAPRPALNVLWEWIGFALCFFATRQLLTGRREVRAVMAVLMATGVALSGYGLFKKYCELPQTRAYYWAHRDQLLPPDAPERKLLEDRLSEPYPRATFALSNSLAGFLVPCAVMYAAILFAPQLSPRTKALAALPAALLLLCLVLTRSRSALIATALGAAATAIAARTGTESRSLSRHRLPRRWRLTVVAALIVLALLAGAAVYCGALRPGIAGAAKSFRYRLEYWQATAAMIADYPWVGCGPGNFQDYYTRYKPPHAPEEITDPHNFLLEVWATAGTPAAMALLVVLGCFLRCVAPQFRLARSLPPSTAPPALHSATSQGSPARSPADPGASVAAARGPMAGQHASTGLGHIVAGMIGGFALAVPLGALSVAPPGVMCVVVGLPLAIVALAALRPWINHPDRPERTGSTTATTVPDNGHCADSSRPEETRIAAVAAGAMLVNLSAAGGIGYPALALTFWLLLAAGLRAAVPPRVYGLRQIVGAAGLALALGLAATCYLTAYAPVLGSRALMERALREHAAGRAESAQEAVQQAAAADPLSSEASRLAAELALQRWCQDANPAALMAAEHYTRQMVRLAPQSAAVWAAAGDIYRRIAQIVEKPETADAPHFTLQAVAAYQQAVDCYPSSAMHRARLALAASAAGQHHQARQAAQHALLLDAQQQMPEKKLPAAVRQQLEALR